MVLDQFRRGGGGGALCLCVNPQKSFHLTPDRRAMTLTTNAATLVHLKEWDKKKSHCFSGKTYFWCTCEILKMASQLFICLSFVCFFFKSPIFDSLWKHRACTPVALGIGYVDFTGMTGVFFFHTQINWLWSWYKGCQCVITVLESWMDCKAGHGLLPFLCMCSRV